MAARGSPSWPLPEAIGQIQDLLPHLKALNLSSLGKGQSDKEIASELNPADLRMALKQNQAWLVKFTEPKYLSVLN